jgi:uncharacterized protein (DUF2062 family)
MSSRVEFVTIAVVLWVNATLSRDFLSANGILALAATLLKYIIFYDFIQASVRDECESKRKSKAKEQSPAKLSN